MTIFRRSAIAAIALTLSLGVTGCSNSHHGATSTGSRATFGQANGSSAPNAPGSSSASSTSSPLSSSPSSSSDSSSTSDPTDDPLASAAMTGNAPSDNGSVPGENGSPRGGRGGASDTSNGSAQALNFFKTNFTYDTKIDTSESGAAARASVYASGALQGSLRTPSSASHEFSDAAQHHGYTTVKISDTQYGQPSASTEYLTVCKAITVTWHGDPGWKPPAPETNSWCVDVMPTVGQWNVTSLSLVNQGS